MIFTSKTKSSLDDKPFNSENYLFMMCFITIRLIPKQSGVMEETEIHSGDANYLKSLGKIICII
ncbi:hypothetical protein pb186bvf_001833 [Paramecium bursaria]